MYIQHAIAGKAQFLINNSEYSTEQQYSITLTALEAMHTHTHTHATHLQCSWRAVSPVHHLSDVVPNPGRPGHQLGIGLHKIELVRLSEEVFVAQTRGKGDNVRVDGTSGRKESGAHCVRY